MNPTKCPKDGALMRDIGYTWKCHRCGHSLAKSKVAQIEASIDPVCKHDTARCSCLNPGHADYKAYCRQAGIRPKKKYRDD